MNPANEEALDEIRLQLSDTLTELRTIRRKLHEFDGTVAAVSLRPELSRLNRYLDTLSETLTIVVRHLPLQPKPTSPDS